MASMGYHKRVPRRKFNIRPAKKPLRVAWKIWGRVGDIVVLEACLKGVWGSIPQERLDSLIRSMPARLQAVIDAEGGATPY